MKSSHKRRFSLPERLFRYLDNRSLVEKLLLGVITSVFLVSGTISILQVNNENLVEVPKEGGSLRIGVIGAPRFINPVLAITKADHDLVELTYSGLMKLNKDGELENDVAKSITISDDGLTYNVILKENELFHDGIPVSAQDFAYTIKLIQNPELKSPLRGNWSGVEIQVVSKDELNIILETAYTPFVENLTVGVLPAHIWSELRTEELPFSQYNTEPIGTGAYEVMEVKRNENGLIDTYSLSPAGKIATYIKDIEFYFFQNEEELIAELEAGNIDSTASLSYANLSDLSDDSYNIIEYPLPRTFTLFLNQNRSEAIRSEAVREALSIAIDRDELVDEVLGGYGYSTVSPIPPGFFEIESDSSAKDEDTEISDRFAAATELLVEAGWKKTIAGTWEKSIDSATTTLELTISTSNTDLFKRTAEKLASAWQELGVIINVELYEQVDLVQSVIRPRDYQALLFGNDVGRSLDLYPFWHSSQREDPGLNVAIYANITTDALLEKLRTSQDSVANQETIAKIENEIVKETPAIFLFTPSLIHISRKNIHVEPVARLSKTSDRLSDLNEWYVVRDRLWPIFTD